MTLRMHSGLTRLFLLLGLFLAVVWTQTAPGSITFNIGQPVEGATYRGTVFVSVGVNSTYQIQAGSVTASIGATQITLALEQSTGSWQGLLSLAGLPYGPLTMTVSAKDIFDNSGQGQRGFIHDDFPVITLLEPATFGVARPTLHFRATCADDGPAGCVSLILKTDFGLESVVLASGTNSIDQVASFASREGKYQPLVLIARDGAGNEATFRFTVYVDSSPYLGELATVPGEILDLQPDRILYIRDGAVPHLVVRALPGGTETELSSPSPGSPSPGPPAAFLTPQGVLFTTSDVHIWEWVGGVATDRGYGSQLRVKGSFATWAGNNGSNVIRRDLSSGTELDLGTGSVADVAENGDVVWANPFLLGAAVHRYRAGSSTTLTGTDDNTYPLTDGVNVAHFKSYHYVGSGYGPPDSGQVAVYKDGADIVLTPVLAPAPAYRVADGYTAFTRPVSGSNQVWLLPPTGSEIQVTAFGSAPTIVGMGTSGRLAITAGGRLYVTGPNGAGPRDVGSSLGRAFFFLQGTFYEVIGRTVFRIADTSDAGAISRLTLISGTVNGQPLTSGSRTVAVAPGAALSGQLQVEATTAWPGGSVVSMGVTPSWGNHATSYVDLGAVTTPASGLARTIPISLTAPTAPGVYHVIAAFRADVTAGNVMSATNYTVGQDVWNNGDDVADWSADRIAVANGSGTVLADYLFPGGNVPVYVPATSFTVVVGGGGGGGCATSGPTLCLLSRFRLSVAWKNPYDGGTTGIGTAVPYSANTGMFWFFDAPNLELMVKVLDGTGVNGHFWLLYGALSDVEYTITVADSASGAVKTYHNPPRTLGSVADVTAF